MAVDKSDNMGMVKALEDVDLRREVIFEFLVELSQVDRLDGYVGPMFLKFRRSSQRKELSSSVRSQQRMAECMPLEIKESMSGGDSPNVRPGRR